MVQKKSERQEYEKQTAVQANIVTDGLVFFVTENLAENVHSTLSGLVEQVGTITYADLEARFLERFKETREHAVRR